jgi:hypothetical protein
MIVIIAIDSGESHICGNVYLNLHYALKNLLQHSALQNIALGYIFNFNHSDAISKIRKCHILLYLNASLRNSNA